jgi:hypothetical protein
MHELPQFNVKINRTSFPAESREIIFTALDDVLKLAICIPQEDPLAFSAYTAFILFPRLILRSLPPGCKGKHASFAFKPRYDMLMDGRVSELTKRRPRLLGYKSGSQNPRPHQAGSEIPVDNASCILCILWRRREGMQSRLLLRH